MVRASNNATAHDVFVHSLEALLFIFIILAAACNIHNLERPWDKDKDGSFSCEGPLDELKAAFDSESNECDCDDHDKNVNPNNKVEVCDGKDNNCDGTVDIEAADAPPWFEDADADGFGNPDEEERSCTPMMSVNTGGGSYIWSENSDDCDDNDASVNPSATEVCGNDIDDDCYGGDESCR